MQYIYFIIFALMYGFTMANLKNDPEKDAPLLVRIVLSLLAASCGIFLLAVWALVAHWLKLNMPWKKGWKLY